MSLHHCPACGETHDQDRTCARPPWNVAALRYAQRDQNLRVRLWGAINRYAEACGADPSKHIYGNIPRMDAVVEVERLVFPDNRNTE